MQRFAIFFHCCISERTNRKDPKFRREIFLIFPLSEHAIPLFPISSFSPTIYRESSATAYPINTRLNPAFDFTRGFRFTRTEKRRSRKSAKELAGSLRRLRRRYLNCRFCLLFPAFVGSQGSTLAMGVQSHRSRGKVGFVSTLFPVSFPPNPSFFLSLFLSTTSSKLPLYAHFHRSLACRLRSAS